MCCAIRLTTRQQQIDFMAPIDTVRGCLNVDNSVEKSALLDLRPYMDRHWSNARNVPRSRSLTAVKLTFL